MVKNAKSNIIHLINSTSEKFKAEEPSLSLSMAILEITLKQPQLLTLETINYIKEEMKTLVG